MINVCCIFRLKILQYFALGHPSLFYSPLCLFGKVFILMLDDPSLEAKASPFLLHCLAFLVPLSQVVEAHAPALLQVPPRRRLKAGHGVGSFCEERTLLKTH